MKTKKIYKLLSLVLAFAFIFSSFGFINARLVKAETNEVTTLINEGFNNGTTAPVGWTFEGINNVYTNEGEFGSKSPSLRFNNSNHSVTTPVFENASQLSFWVRGMSQNGSDLVVSVLNEGKWEVLDYINPVPATGTVKTYPLTSKVTQVKFIQLGNQGEFALDDVKVDRITTNTNPPTDNTPKVTIARLNKTSIVINQGKFAYVNIITTPGNASIKDFDYNKSSVTGVTITQDKKNKRLLKVTASKTASGTQVVNITVTVNGKPTTLKLTVKVLPTKIKPVKPVKPVTTKKN